MSRFEHHVFVCENLRDAADPKGSCAAKGSAEIRAKLRTEIKARGIKGVRVNTSGCLDACEHGPSVVVYPEGVWYGHVSVDDVHEIIESHIVGNARVERLLITDPKYNQNPMLPLDDEYGVEL